MADKFHVIEVIDAETKKSGLMPHIPAIWAFLAIDQDGDEVVCGMLTEMGWLPMIAADETRLTDLRKKADVIARATGQTIRLVKFTARIEIEEIKL